MLGVNARTMVYWCQNPQVTQVDRTEDKRGKEMTHVEAYFTAETVKTMEKAILSKLSPKRIIRVPVYTYTEALAA